MKVKHIMLLSAHYKAYLGEIARGWSDEKQPHDIQIVCFERQPELGVRTFATLGLSRHIL